MKFLRMKTLIQDARFALRKLLRAPAFLIVTVLTLALGIGANVSIFSIVHGVVLQPLPFENGDELVLVRQHFPADGDAGQGLSVLEMKDYADGNRTMTGLVEYHSLWFTLFESGTPERVQSGVVSWDFFRIVGIQPLHGRLFLASEDEFGAEPVLVLGHDFWQERFGGDPGVIGRTVEMNDHLHTIVGILPPLPTYFGDNHVWMPWYACPFRTAENWLTNREWRSLTVIGRLAPETGLELARTDFAGVAHSIHDDHPAIYGDRPGGNQPGYAAALTPLRQELSRDARPVFLLLLGISGFVLLIACANVTNLTLARISRRRHELAVCSALGANPARLRRQILLESMIVALAGGILGLLVATPLNGLFSAFALRFSPRGAEVGVGAWVLLFTLGVSILAGLVTGGTSSLLFARGSSRSIREQSRNATEGSRARRAQGILVISQVAITFVLLVGSGLVLRSFINLQRIDPGFDPENVLVLQLDLDWTTYMEAEARRPFFEGVVEQMTALPAVLSAGIAGSIPLGGGLPREAIEIEGRGPSDPGTSGIQVNDLVVSPGYFESLGVPFVQGRDFKAADRFGAPRVVIINRSMARRHWNAEQAIGSRISADGQNWATIVGVVGDVKQEGLENDIRDQIYIPLDQSAPLNASVLIRTSGNPANLAREAVAAVHAVDPRQPVASTRTMQDIRDESIASPRLTMILLGFFGALALAISLAGIAALIAFTVSQRIPEIGIRIALGESQRAVLWTVMRRGIAMIVSGLVLGAIAAFALARTIGGWLYDVPTSDPWTFAAVALALLSAALVAAVLPARRATRVDPGIALRAE